MALIVTYTHAYSQSREAITASLAVGSKARTESLTLSGSSTAGSLVAANIENVCDVYAVEACWIKFGTSPTATVAGSDMRYLAAGERMQYYVNTGQKIAGILA